MVKNYYEILGINLQDIYAELPDTGELVSMANVKKVFKELMLLHHPDKVTQNGGTQAQIKEAHIISQPLIEAFNILKQLHEDGQKLKYDKNLRRQLIHERETQSRAGTGTRAQGSAKDELTSEFEDLHEFIRRYEAEKAAHGDKWRAEADIRTKKQLEEIDARSARGDHSWAATMTLEPGTLEEIMRRANTIKLDQSEAEAENEAQRRTQAEARRRAVEQRGAAAQAAERIRPIGREAAEMRAAAAEARIKSNQVNEGSEWRDKVAKKPHDKTNDIGRGG